MAVATWLSVSMAGLLFAGHVEPRLYTISQTCAAGAVILVGRRNAKSWPQAQPKPKKGEVRMTLDEMVHAETLVAGPLAGWQIRRSLEVRCYDIGSGVSAEILKNLEKAEIIEYSRADFTYRLTARGRRFFGV